MKWLASFLAILVLFLSVQPVCAAPVKAVQADACCADDDCGDQENRESNDTEKNDCSGCNPFQSSCACCAAGVIVPQQTLALRALPQPQLQRAWSIAAPQFPAAVYGDFWQPPKIR